MIKKIWISLLTIITALFISFNFNVKASSNPYSTSDNLFDRDIVDVNLTAGPGDGAFIRFNIVHQLEFNTIIIKNLNKISIDTESLVSGLRSNVQINESSYFLKDLDLTKDEVKLFIGDQSNLELTFMILQHMPPVNASLYADYFLDTIEVYYTNNQVNEVNNIANLPITLGNFSNGLTNVGVVTVTKLSENVFNILIEYNAELYEITLDNVPEYIQLAKKVHYFTDNNQRYLVGFYESNDTWINNNSFVDDIIDNSWIVWNMTTGDFTRSETNTVHAKVTSRSKGIRYTNQLWAEVVFPHDLDDLLSISVGYEYRHVYLIGNKGSWQSVNEQFLFKNEKGNFELPWYNSLFGFYNWAINSNRYTRNLFGIDQIEELTPDATYMNEYVEWMNERNVENEINKVYTTNEIFVPNSKTYSLYLGTFNKFGSVNLDTRNFAVFKYRYEYKGVIYSNPYPKIEAPDNKYNKSDIDPVITWFKELFAKLWAFIVKYSWIAIPFIGFATAPLALKGASAVFGKKVYKKRLLFVLGWVALLLLGWFLLI